jgi:hypothetical protein
MVIIEHDHTPLSNSNHRRINNMGDGTPVDDIAQDDQKLEEKATELVRRTEPVSLKSC